MLSAAPSSRDLIRLTPAHVQVGVAYGSRNACGHVWQPVRSLVAVAVYFAVSHPSEPNYVALLGGSTFNVADDSAY